MPLLSLDDVSIAFSHVPLLDHASLLVEPGERVAVIEKGIYQPSCTHTWAVGLDGKTGAVTEVRVVEMSCPHAFPAKAASYLEQYKGKGPADVAKLDSQIQTIAKATGSCRLTTEAVSRAITGYSKAKGQL